MDALDRHIHADEERLLENNSLALLSEADRKSLYRAGNPLKALALSDQIAQRTTSAARRQGPYAFDKNAEDDPGSLTYLTRTHKGDILPCMHDERLLASEYAAVKRMLFEEEEDDGKGQYTRKNTASARSTQTVKRTALSRPNRTK